MVAFYLPHRIRVHVLDVVRQPHAAWSSWAAERVNVCVYVCATVRAGTTHIIIIVDDGAFFSSHHCCFSRRQKHSHITIIMLDAVRCVAALTFRILHVCVCYRTQHSIVYIVYTYDMHIIISARLLYCRLAHLRRIMNQPQPSTVASEPANWTNRSTVWCGRELLFFRFFLY